MTVIFLSDSSGAAIQKWEAAPWCFVEKAVLKNFATFTGKQLQLKTENLQFLRSIDVLTNDLKYVKSKGQIKGNIT